MKKPEASVLALCKKNGSTNSIIVTYPYLPTPLLGQDMTQGHFLSGV